jgi:predicted RNase H-like HicB family nuclease
MEVRRGDRFTVSVHRAHGCYFACVAQLPGCVARGATEVEAVENARAAIRTFLRTAQLLASDPATVRLEIGV